jgi:hypothetical protein
MHKHIYGLIFLVHGLVKIYVPFSLVLVSVKVLPIQPRLRDTAFCHVLSCTEEEGVRVRVRSEG